MATFNWPGFGIAAITPTLDQPAQVNRSAYTGVRAVASNPWHGKWSFKVQLATRQGDGAFQAIRAFFTGLQGTINNFHLPAVEAPQNANTGVTLSANAAQGAVSLALTGVTTALVAGNMATIAGQLLSITSVGALSGSAQTISFMPALRAAALSGASVETAKPYALVALTDSAFSWDIAQWRQYGLSFTVDEDVGGTDGASPSGDTWNATFSSSGGSSGPVVLGVAVENNGGAASQVTTLNFTGDAVSIAGSTATIPVGANDYVSPLTYGVIAGTGNGAANDTAMLAMFADLRTKATNVNSLYQGTIPIHFPAGYFEFSSTIDLTDGTFILQGATAAGPGGLGTVLKFPAGVTGIRTQRDDTSGASSTRTAARGADASIIRNLALQGAYSSTESETHGIHLRASAHVENVYIANFEGDGVYAHVSAGSGGATEGNTNQSRLYNLHIQGCRDALNIDGADVNIWTVISLLATSNRRWGVWDSSFLGNSYFGCQSDSNGLIPGVAPCVVSQGGNRYCVVNGQAAGASTNAPSGTTASNTWWIYMGVGGVSAPNNIPAWLSGTTYRAGGAFLTDDTGNATNLFSGCYIEGGQGFAQFVTPTLVLGGAMSPSVRGVACLTGAGTQIRSDSDLGALGGLQILGGTSNVGPTTGTTDLTFNLNSTSTETGFWQYLNGVLKGYIRNISGVLYLNAVAGIRLRFNGTDAAILGSTGLTYQSGFNPTLTEIAAASVTVPAVGSQTLFIDTADHKLKRKDSGGTVTIIA